MGNIAKLRKKIAAGELNVRAMDIQTENGRISPWELGNGHIACGACGCPRFNIIKMGNIMSIGCSKCAWDIQMDLDPDKLSRIIGG